MSLDVIITKCNHSFHTNCLNNWFKTAGTCPMCRETLTDRPSSPNSVLDLHFQPNADLGQVLDYGDI